MSVTLLMKKVGDGSKNLHVVDEDENEVLKIEVEYKGRWKTDTWRCA